MKEDLKGELEKLSPMPLITKGRCDWSRRFAELKRPEIEGTILIMEMIGPALKRDNLLGDLTVLHSG